MRNGEWIFRWYLGLEMPSLYFLPAISVPASVSVLNFFLFVSLSQFLNCILLFIIVFYFYFLFLFYFPSVAVCSFNSLFILLFLLLFSGPYYVSCSLCFFFCFWFCYCAAFCSFFFLSFWFCLCDLLCFSFSFCFMHRWIRIEVCARCV